MKRIWQRIVECVFPGTYEEYVEARQIHKVEIRKYRKNPQYLAGLALFFISLVALLVFAPFWWLKLLAFLMMIGELLIRDTISEHYCARLNRQRKIGSDNTL
jgi:hypothetical protein